MRDIEVVSWDTDGNCPLESKEQMMLDEWRPEVMSSVRGRKQELVQKQRESCELGLMMAHLY